MSLEKKLIISIVIILGLILILVVFFIKPTFSEIEKMRKEIKTELMTIEKSYLKSQILTKAKKEFNEIEKNIQSLQNIFLSEEKGTEFITFLEKIAHQYNIIQEIKIGEAQSLKDDYKVISLQLSLKGSFFNLIRYFQEIENLDFYFNIESLTLTTVNDEEVMASVTAKIYWRK